MEASQHVISLQWNQWSERKDEIIDTDVLQNMPDDLDKGHWTDTF